MITLPPLITNIQSQVKAKRVQNIKQKFSKATDKMLAMSGMNGYGSTENFVEELKHHLKIAKVCDNDHLAECWGYDKVKLKDGKEWEISKTKTGINLIMFDNDKEEWADTVGIVTADGTSMILSYNKKCNMTMDVNPQWDESQSTSTNCIAAVFDYNGSKKPNKFIGDITNKDYKKSDIIAFNAGGLGKGCSFQLDNKCFGQPFIPTIDEATQYGKNWCNGGVGDNTARGEAAKLGIKYCNYDTDFWNATVVRCGGIPENNKMITKSDLEKIALMVYKKTDGTLPSSLNDIQWNSSGKYSYSLDKDILLDMGFKGAGTTIWTSEYNATYSYRRYFNANYSDYAATAHGNAYRYNNMYGVCRLK